MQLWDATGEYTVPNVQDLDLAAATEILEEIGFEVASAPREDGSVAPDTVLEQTPPAGEGNKAPIGSTVNLIVAAPEGPVTVPNVTGRPLADAQQALADASFGHTSTSEPSESVAEGSVIRTEPGANEEVEPGATITIVVSSGPPPTEEPTEEPSESPSEGGGSPSGTPSETPSESSDPPADGEDSAAGPANGQGEANRSPQGRENGNGNG